VPFPTPEVRDRDFLEYRDFSYILLVFTTTFFSILYMWSLRCDPYPTSYDP
jgi:hypothetical protein